MPSLTINWHSVNLPSVTEFGVVLVVVVLFVVIIELDSPAGF